jgi:Ca-activated chloride channel family protein
MMLQRVGDTNGQIELYRALRSDPVAGRWTRDVVLRTLARTGELARIRELGLGRLDPDMMTAALGRAATPAQRLAVLAELSRRYPDDLDLGLRLLDDAMTARASDVVRATAVRLRARPDADARVRTAVGEALLSVGDEAEARRAFSEIVEFAPDDPQARRRLGDIALSHGWADEAYRQFAMLAALADDAPDVLLRQAMAARMAGRLDEALRLATRVAEQSSGDARGTSAADTAATWISATLATAAHDGEVGPEALAALRARWRRSPAARGAGDVRVLLEWFHPDDGAELWLRAAGEPTRRADQVASAVFLESCVLTELGAAPALELEVRRGTTARPRGRVALVLVWYEGTDRERVERRWVDLDEQHPAHAFRASPSGVTELPPPSPPAASTNARRAPT